MIFGSFLASNDHCYVLLIVADHFESRVLYVHTPFIILLGSKISHQVSVKNLYRRNRMIRPSIGSSGHLGHFISGRSQTIQPLPGSSGSTACFQLWKVPDDPALPRIIRPRQFPLYKARAVGALVHYFLSSATAPFLLQTHARRFGD